MIDVSGFVIADEVIKDPFYREGALTMAYRTYEFPHCRFHGIAAPGGKELVDFIVDNFSRLEPTLTFFRKSPLGQVEPHFIHTDIDMGDWSALLYLNPDPPEGDGTDFWTHKATGAIESRIPHERSEEGKDPSNWILREQVAAKFNRLLIFPSSYFHSRAIAENWGSGGEARLVQVVFGKGQL